MTQILKQSTAVDILIGPFVDSADGYTAETGVSPAVKLSKNGQALAAKNDVTTPVHDADGYYNCELDATDTDTVGTLVLSVVGSATSLPVRHEFQVVEEALYDGLYASGAARIPADATAISGDTAAADNLEAMYDGTGYTDDTAPASRSQVDGIGAASGGSLNFQASEDNTGGAIKSVTFVGTQTGTFANTEAEDASYHVIDHDTNDIDIVYGFDIGGGRTATELTFKGFLNGGNDDMLIQAYDFVGADWETRVQLPGKSGTTNDTISASLLSKHTGTGADLGKVYIRFEADGSMSSPDLNVDELLVAAVNIGQSVGYANGMIWIDTASGTAGTESFVNGTADNPVDSIADAITLSSALGLKAFHLAAGSSITLTMAATDYEFKGDNWTLAFGGQSIAGAKILGATVSGIFTGTTAILEDCIINAITGPGITMRRCFFNDVTITANGVGDWFLNDCRSRVAGTASANFDFGAAVGNTSFNLRGYSGGIELENMGGAGTDTASIEGFGGITLNANCSGGTLAIRGTITVTDNAGGAVTLSDDARIDVAQINAEADTAISDAALATASALATVDTNVDAILVDTGTTIPGVLGTPAGVDLATDIAAVKTDSAAILVDTGTTLDGKIDTIDTVVDAIKVVTDALGATAAGVLADSMTATISTTVNDASASTTAFVTALTEATDDHYNGRIIVFIDGALAGQATDITDYTGATKTVTVTALTEAPGNGDAFVIV